MAEPWNDARIESLKKHVGEGLTLNQIAACMSTAGRTFSRNAIMGKVYRLGLTLAGSTNAPGWRPRVAKAAPPKRDPKPATNRSAKSKPYYESPESPGMVKLLDLRVCHCRWPVGDPTSEDFRFCGRPMVRGAYCTGHAARAYTGIPQKQSRAA